MPRVVCLNLPTNNPIVGCELTPYILLSLSDGSFTDQDVTETSPVDGHFLRYSWCRSQSDKQVSLCSVHPSEPAKLQCVCCVRAKVLDSQSYHCSTKCFLDAWPRHRAFHDSAARDLLKNGNDASVSSSGSTSANRTGSTPLSSAVVPQRNGGETWLEVGRSKTYIPTAADIGRVLKFHCTIIDAKSKLSSGEVNSIPTQHVIAPPLRWMIPVDGADVKGQVDSVAGSFSVLSYNILADWYERIETYFSCPSFALSWSYRRQNLLREIVAFSADIVCLQEVQIDHYQEFFFPELSKHGYKAFYKMKTMEIRNERKQTIDGCATFFRRDRFAFVKKYEVEFDKEVQFLMDALFPAQKDMLKQLDNIALVLVLKSQFSNGRADEQGKSQYLCVVNTHIQIHRRLKHTKLLQVHTLLKVLENLVDCADIPIVICGDFSTIPGNVDQLITLGSVDSKHPDLDLAVDPLNICLPQSKLVHQLKLVTAYSSLASEDDYFINLRRRLVPTNEPFFTTITSSFCDTVDYMFYTAGSLKVESLLEIIDKQSLRRDTGLPSPIWSSNHIALLARFRYNSETKTEIDKLVEEDQSRHS